MSPNILNLFTREAKIRILKSHYYKIEKYFFPETEKPHKGAFYYACEFNSTKKISYQDFVNKYYPNAYWEVDKIFNEKLVFALTDLLIGNGPLS